MIHPNFTHLPIEPYLADIAKTLAETDVLVLQADPGAGKSTAVPLYLLQNLDLGGKKILMLEPRRLAAKSIAEYLAKQLGEKVGDSIGYQIRHERKVGANTRLEIITEGILTQRLQSDPEMADTGLVIFDEFHERSIHADFGLSLCQDIRAAFNESLKLLVMSATIDTQMLSEFLDKAPVIQSEGRCFPIQTHYLSQTLSSSHSRDWLPILQKLVVKAIKTTDGDVLVFLPGQGEIKRCLESLNSIFDSTVVVLPLYGGLRPEAQQQALVVDSKGRQKIVLATNIAETSLTIANISVVVDSGFEKTALYDVSSGMTRLVTQRIARASAEQRQGRAGRVQAGSCYRLWTESQHQTLNAFSTEEITTSDLASLQLSLSQWGLQSHEDLAWITPPPKPHIKAAQSLLNNLELIDRKNKLTAKGQKALLLNSEPRFASLLESVKHEPESLRFLACDLVAVLTDSHFYQSQNDADLVKRLLAIQLYRKNRSAAQKSYPIKTSVAEQVLKTAQRLHPKMQLKGVYEHALTELQQQLGGLVALAFPDRIAKQRDRQSNRYLLANGKGALIPELNALQNSEWLAIADLDGQRQEGRIYLATQIDQAWLERNIGFKDEAVYFYDKSSQKIVGKQQQHLGQIVLAEQPLKKPDLAKLQACLQQAIVESKLEVLPLKKSTQAWLNRVNWLMSVAPQAWPELSTKSLLNSVEKWLFPYMENVHAIQALQQLDLDALIKAILPYEALAEIEKQAPEFYQTPSGKRLKLNYQVGQLPKVSVVLQEVFGELTSPKLAWGQVNMSFELLSPAQRPIQVTSDLENFWLSSYFEIAKEMKGRYPKHRWPDQPLLEKAGRSIKAKKHSL